MAVKNKCAACGNNPVPHFFQWYTESVNIFFTPLRGFVLFNPFSRMLGKWFRNIPIGLYVVAVLKKIGIITVNNNRALCKAPRALVLWEEAEKRGLYFEELMLFGRPFDTYVAVSASTSQLVSASVGQVRSVDQLISLPVNQLGIGSGRQLGSESGGGGYGRRFLFSGLPRPWSYDASVLDTMDDKYILKKKFEHAGLPVPRGGSASSFRQAKKIFNEINHPVIVKPRTGSRGRHSTTFVETFKELESAVSLAKELCYWVIVEEQLFGPVYRATVINYKLAGVLRGDAPSVIGDGVKTIYELVQEKNKSSHVGIKDMTMTTETDYFLDRQQLAVSSVPASGQRVFLTEKIGVNYGGSSSEDYEICHPETKELFEQAARVLGDSIVGFDFIIPDITVSYKQQRCGFIEANSLPFINLHHDPLHGIPRNAAGAVWDLILEGK